MEKKSNITRMRKKFLIVFIMSTFLFFIIVAYELLLPSYSKPVSVEPPSDEYNRNIVVSSLATLVGIAGSCLTSVVTFLGFVSTTVIVWRKESREKKDRELDTKRKEIEIEKERLELEKLRAEQEKQFRKKTTK